MLVGIISTCWGLCYSPECDLVIAEHEAGQLQNFMHTLLQLPV